MLIEDWQEVFPSKAFWQIVGRRKEGEEGELSSAAKLEQINKTN